MRQRRSAWGAATGCALLLFWGCMGGTGTDTENGVYVSALVVDSSGEPVGNVEIGVLDLQARGDSTVTSPLVDQDVILTTDASGAVDFFLKKNGVYMATGKRGDSVLFIDTLRTRTPVPSAPTSPGGIGSPEFRIETPTRATGKVRLLSGLSLEGGRVMLRGTKITSEISDSGSYNLGWLPASAQKTAVTLVYQGRERRTRYVKVSSQGGQITVHAATVAGRCLADSTSAVNPALSGPGSLSSQADVARLVGRACPHRVGDKVRVLEINASSGAVIRARGDYVIPAADAPSLWAGADSTAVPTECIEPERNPDGLTGSATLRLSNHDIVVDDFKKGCLQ